MVLRYLNPFWLAYAVTVKPAVTIAKWLFKAPLWLLKKTKPKSFLGKLLWYPTAIWIAIPGTIPLTYYWAYSVFTGNEEQFNATLQGLITTAKVAWAVASSTYQVLAA